jgi:hypothetical protein
VFFMRVVVCGGWGGWLRLAACVPMGRAWGMRAKQTGQGISCLGTWDSFMLYMPLYRAFRRPLPCMSPLFPRLYVRVLHLNRIGISCTQDGSFFDRALREGFTPLPSLSQACPSGRQQATCSLPAPCQWCATHPQAINAPFAALPPSQVVRACAAPEPCGHQLHR